MSIILTAYTKHYLCYPNVKSLTYDGKLENAYNNNVVKATYEWHVEFGNDINGDGNTEGNTEDLQISSVRIKENLFGGTFTVTTKYSNRLLHKIAPEEAELSNMISDSTLMLQEGMRQVLVAYFDKESEFSQIILKKVEGQSTSSIDFVKSKIDP